MKMPHVGQPSGFWKRKYISLGTCRLAHRRLFGSNADTNALCEIKDLVGQSNQTLTNGRAMADKEVQCDKTAEEQNTCDSDPLKPSLPIEDLTARNEQSPAVCLQECEKSPPPPENDIALAEGVPSTSHIGSAARFNKSNESVKFEDQPDGNLTEEKYREEPDDDCIVQCLYYVDQCCECSVS